MSRIEFRMRNRLTDTILFLLAVILLVPCPVPSAWIQIADAGRFSRDGLVESLQPGAIASSTIPNNGFVNDEVRKTIEGSCDELGILSISRNALRQGGFR